MGCCFFCHYNVGAVSSWNGMGRSIFRNGAELCSQGTIKPSGPEPVTASLLGDWAGTLFPYTVSSGHSVFWLIASPSRFQKVPRHMLHFVSLYCGLEIFTKQHLSFARWKGLDAGSCGKSGFHEFTVFHFRHFTDTINFWFHSSLNYTSIFVLLYFVFS